MFIDLEVEDVVESSAWWSSALARDLLDEHRRRAEPRAERLTIIGHGRSAGSPATTQNAVAGVPA